MPDPHLMRQQVQRSWLRTFILRTSLPLNPLDSHAPGPSKTRFADCSGPVPVFMPDPRLLDPVSLFLTDERSDAIVVGSGNKAMGRSPFLMFSGWDNLKFAGLGGSIRTIKSS